MEKLNKDDLKILPDEELRAHFKHNKAVIKFISLPMLAYIYLGGVLLPDMVGSNAGAGLTGFSMVAGFICYSFIFSNTPEMQKKLVIAVDIFQLLLILAGFIVVGLINGNFFPTLVQFLSAAAANVANLIARPIIKEMSDLREHPRYPFDNWRRDESFTHAVFTNGSTDSRAVKRIESTLNQGKVVAGGHEDIFEGDVKKSEPAKEELVELFQEKARVWTDESDKTSYILDNLDKMYFDDGLQNGELVGEELEKQLRKATAPAKPPEETPEDFFQQQTIVWRPQKHGSTNEGPREDPSASSEEKSRTVLM
ncbi:hypothetical protein SAMN02910317_00104 [Ruminococcaceae bacterium FB2012]|nr:hypothetical protein SAMN02910317_00104 [Ruminococcaceae bacterium FB2012]